GRTRSTPGCWRRRSRTRSCCTACRRTAARRSPTRCSTGRRALCSTRPPTACTRRRRCCAGCWERRHDPARYGRPATRMGGRPEGSLMAGAVTKAARHARIVELIRDRAVRSQTELAELLAADGIQVTQATLSRDLEELGAVKVRGTDGQPPAYLIPEEGRPPLRPAAQAPARLVRLLRELLTGTDHSGDPRVLRT